MNSDQDESPIAPATVSHTESTAPATAPAVAEQPSAAPAADTSESAAPRIRIGTQRPGSPLVRARAPAHRYVDSTAPPTSPDAAAEARSESKPLSAAAPAVQDKPATREQVTGREQVARRERRPGDEDDGPATPALDTPAYEDPNYGVEESHGRGGKKFPVPNLRKQLPPELEDEVEAALGGLSLEEAMAPGSAAPPQAEIEPDTRRQARVMRVHRENVFLDLGERNQGILPLKVFRELPVAGATFEVAVVKFDADEGLYQLTLPNAAIAGANWGSLTEGVLVEARVTGHNKGGLECEVNNIRAFIPASQIGPYRVEDLSQFVGEKFVCLVSEANPERGNLILSRRDVIDRERAEAKEKLLTELKEGEIRDGVVRSLQAFGAFVDLGGVDGLLHVSQLSWQRVKHPSDVLQLGQPIKVMIRKIDPDTHKISLAYRDLMESPWTTAAAKYPVSSRVEGSITKIMEFGAFMQLEPGVEGLVHISELAHKRVFRVGDVVKEGDVVEAKVLSIDPEQQRISLSIKALAARPMPIKKEEDVEESAEEAAAKPVAKPRSEPLKGGTGRASGGDQFGLKW